MNQVPRASQPLVTVSYRVGMADYLRGSAAAARRARGAQLLGILTAVICAFAAVALRDVLSVVGIALGIGIATGWVVVPFVWRQARSRAIADGLEETMTADETGIRFRSSLADEFHTWEAYRGTHDGGGYLVMDAGFGVVQLLPKRAFGPAELATFERLLDRHGLFPTGGRR